MNNKIAFFKQGIFLIYILDVQIQISKYLDRYIAEFMQNFM